MSVWLLAVAEPSLAGDPAAGEAVFSNCRACHAVGPEPPARMGPPLNGLFGRAAGSVPGYRYSPALAASGIVWSPDSLAAFLPDPQGLVPGTRMPNIALHDAQRIADLAAYLARFAPDGTAASP